jgi:hypothetical protein
MRFCPCLAGLVGDAPDRPSAEEGKSLLMTPISAGSGKVLPVILVRGGGEVVKHGAMVKRKVQLVMSDDGANMVYSSTDGPRQHVDGSKTIAMGDIISVSEKYKSDEHPLAFAINAGKLHIFDAFDAGLHKLWVQGLNDEVRIYKHHAGIGRSALQKGLELQKQGMLMKSAVFLKLSDDGRQLEYCPPSHMHGLGAVKTIPLEEINEVVTGPSTNAVTVEIQGKAHHFYFASPQESSAWLEYLTDAVLSYTTKKHWQQAKQKAMEQTAAQMIQEQKQQQRQETRRTQDRIRDKYKSGKR